jgi:hypothetical protein
MEFGGKGSMRLTAAEVREAKHRPAAAADARIGKILQLVISVFNKSLRVVSLSDRLTGDPGAVLLRNIMEAGVFVTCVGDRLKYARRQVYLPSLFRATVLLAAQGRRDHDHADALWNDPAGRLASSSSIGLTPLVVEKGLASQPTLSRFTAIMADPRNLVVLREGVLELAARAQRALNGGHRLQRVTLNIDSLPIEVHSHEPKAARNGYYRARIYHPLVTSTAETGDMLDARLRPGNVGTVDGALDAILNVVDGAQAAALCKVAMVRMDAGFPSAGLLAGFDA